MSNISITRFSVRQVLNDATSMAGDLPFMLDELLNGAPGPLDPWSAGGLFTSLLHNPIVLTSSETFLPVRCRCLSARPTSRTRSH